MGNRPCGHNACSYEESVGLALEHLEDKQAFMEEFRVVFDEWSEDGTTDFESMQEIVEEAGWNLIGCSMRSSLSKRGEFERFDFNGNGELEFYEAWKCFLSNVKQFVKQHGGTPKVEVPHKTPEQAGYTVTKTLGEGGQGQIKLAKSAKLGDVAIKVYDKSNENAADLSELVAELEVMKEIQKSPYVMHAFEIFQDADHYYCVDELLAGGDLTGIREKVPQNGIALTEPYWRAVFVQCARGLAYMHRHGLMHCDIKEENIMFKTKDYVKPQMAIIDFGLSQFSASDQGKGGGTPGYIPPETHDDDVWYPRGDVFSMGVVFFQLLANLEDLFTDEDLLSEGDEDAAIASLTKTREPPWERIDGQYPAVKAWLQKMLAKERLKRFTGAVLLEQPWFQAPTQYL